MRKFEDYVKRILSLDSEVMEELLHYRGGRDMVITCIYMRDQVNNGILMAVEVVRMTTTHMNVERNASLILVIASEGRDESLSILGKYTESLLGDSLYRIISDRVPLDPLRKFYGMISLRASYEYMLSEVLE